MLPLQITSSASLKALLDRALCAGCGDVADQNKETGDSYRSQLDLTILHKLLNTIIEGQSTLMLNASDQEARIDNIETNLEKQIQRVDDLAHWTERRRSNKASPDNSDNALRKSPLPPIGQAEDSDNSSKSPSRTPSITERPSRRGSLKRVASSGSVLRMAQASVMNFADKNDLDRINTRISLLQTKLDKLTDIVPTNEQIMAMTTGAQTTGEPEETTVSESWSKHVLSKRIESNEESLEKFMQLIDDLGKKIKSMQTSLSDQLRQATSSNASDEQVRAAHASIKDILARLAKMEQGMPALDSLSSKLAKLTKAQEKLTSEGDSRNGDLQKSLKNLEDMLMALDKQCRSGAQQLAHLQASVAAAAEGKAVAPPPPMAPVEPVRDLETIRALGEINDRLGSVDERLVGLESLSHLGKEDLEIMKATILEEMPVYIENALGHINEQLAALQKQNEKLNEIIELKRIRDEEALANQSVNQTASTRPRSRPSSARVDIDRLASKQQLEQVKEKLDASTQRLDDRISTEILSLHDKLGGGSDKLWIELEAMRGQFGNFENDLTNMRQQLLSKPVLAEGVPLKGESSLSDVNTLSPALAALLDRMQKKTFELGQSLEDVAGSLVRLDEDGRVRSGSIEALRERVARLEETKADKVQIDTLEDKKADRAELDVKVSRDDFDGAISDMQKQLEGLVTNMLEVEESWKQSLEQTNTRLKKTLNSDDMDAFRRGLEMRLKSLKTLLETTRQEETTGGDCAGDSALYRKPLMGFKCVTCDKVTFPEPGFPVASIPVSGSLPHMNTIRPYTTFDLHNIREQSKLKKTGYEERVWLRMKTNLDRSYRQHVAESMNYAFNAFEQGATETVPIAGGASVPKCYHIAPAGRSCGGGHTRTNPHVRFTHLKNLAEIWQDPDAHARQGTPAEGQEHTPHQPVRSSVQAGDDVARKFDESRREIQILGADGHVYKGRNATQQQVE